MSAPPSVTVILPVHNGAQYLKLAIDSVLAQDYRDFELHVLDDGSTDDSARIALGTGDQRVRYSSNPERFGLFKTLNRGFSEAGSSLVRIWAHDDVMIPGSLRTFVEFAKRHPSAGLVYSDFVSIDERGHRTGKDVAHRAQHQRTPELAGEKISALLFWCYGCLPGNISTTMLRRDAWSAVGGFLIGHQQAPDYDMWVRISERFDVGFISEKLVELREHEAQLGRLGQKQMTTIEEELPVLRMLERRLAGVATERELRKGWVAERGRQHIHWVACALARGDFSAAARGFLAVSAYGHPLRQAAFWLLSGNGRWLMPDRERLYDLIARRLAPPG